MATNIPNFEEAAALATESISSLDNLPNEVQHILNEISHLERKCQDLQNENLLNQKKYIYEVIRPGSSGTGESGLSGLRQPSPTKATLPPRIASTYAEIDALSAEKMRLADRLIQLLARTQSRLDADVTKVRMLQGESLEDIRRSGRHEPSLSANVSTATQITHSIRNVLEGPSDSFNTIALTPTASTPSAHVNKKRRLTTQSSIKVAAAPSPASTSATAYSRSRPSRQAQVTKLSLEEPDDDDLDADGEEEFEGDEGEEDPTLYCFCQKRSYGDMIGCDSKDCPYQWFHISCVGVKTPLPDKWYCPDCVKTKGVPERRKGRKK